MRVGICGQGRKQPPGIHLTSSSHPLLCHPGVAFANGKPWKALRRFCLSTMKDLGVGRRSIEQRIKEEAQCLVEELQNSQGEPQAWGRWSRREGGRKIGRQEGEGERERNGGMLRAHIKMQKCQEKDLEMKRQR